MCYLGAYGLVEDNTYQELLKNPVYGEVGVSFKSTPKIELKPKCCIPDDAGNVQCGTSGCGGHCK